MLPTSINFLDYLHFLFLLVAHRLIFRPLFGQEIGMAILKPNNQWMFFILVFGLGFYIVRLFYKKFNYNYILLILAIFLQLSLIILTIIVRPLEVNHLYFQLTSDDTLRSLSDNWLSQTHRYAFIGSFLGNILIGMVLFHAFKNQTMRKYVFIGYLVLMIANSRSYFWLEAWGNQKDWHTAAQTIKKVIQTGCPPQADILINPDPNPGGDKFYFKVTAPESLKRKSPCPNP